MADKTFNLLIPALKAIDLGDGTHAMATISVGTPTIGDGLKVVTTAGTRVALAASTECKWVIITAATNNTGVVVVGGSTVVALLANRRGTPLYAGESMTLPVDNLADIYLDATVNTQGVTYTYGV